MLRHRGLTKVGLEGFFKPRDENFQRPRFPVIPVIHRGRMEDRLFQPRLDGWCDDGWCDGRVFGCERLITAFLIPWPPSIHRASAYVKDIGDQFWATRLIKNRMNRDFANVIHRFIRPFTTISYPVGVHGDLSTVSDQYLLFYTMRQPLSKNALQLMFS